MVINYLFIYQKNLLRRVILLWKLGFLQNFITFFEEID